MTKTQDLVDSAGQSDAVVNAAPVVHRADHINREDWVLYNAEFLHNTWRLIREEAVGFIVLDLATYADWEDFCWKRTRARDQSLYSSWLISQDDM